LTDPILPNIRIGNSGPDVDGTTGHVLTKVAGGVQFQAPAAGAGGTPLTKCAWVDAAAPAGGNGFVSQEKAFNSIQDALDAGAESIFIAPGIYGNISLTGSALVYLCGLVEPGRNGRSFVSIGTIAVNKTGGDVCLQNLGCGDITDTSGVAVILTFVDASVGAVSGSTQTVIRTGTQTQNMDPGFPPVNTNGLVACAEVDLSWANCAGAVQCSVFYGFRASVAGAVTCSSTVNPDHCSFSQAVTCTGGGISKVKSSTFAAAVLFDQCDTLDSTFAADVSGDAGGGMSFRSSLLTSTVQNPVSWDDTTERRSLAGGVALLGDRVLALSIGQGGDADVQTGDATVNFTGNKRSIYARGSLGADATFTLGLAGLVAGQLTTYALDVWNTAHNITCKFGAATIVTIAPQTSGKGTRFLFQGDTTATQITLLGSRQL
jgi:hypothetical protein